MEASETRIVSPSYSTAPLYPNHPLTQTSPTLTPSRASYYRSTPRMAMRTQPTMSLGFSARVTEAMTLSPLSFRKRYRGTSEPILDTETKGDESEAEGTGSESEESEDEGPDSESEDAASEDQRHALGLAEGPVPGTFKVGQSSRFVPDQWREDDTPMLPTRPTWVDPKDGTVYIDIEFNAPPVRAPVQTLASPEWSSNSLPVSPASLIVPSPVTTHQQP
ncbi:hypothetical protein Tco_0514806 [Tanacetum coccineum]